MHSPNLNETDSDKMYASITSQEKLQQMKRDLISEMKEEIKRPGQW